MNAFARIIAIFLACIMIIIVPTQNYAETQERAIENEIKQRAAHFAYEVRKSHVIKKENYEEFLELLSNTGNLYDIEIEIARPLELELDDNSVATDHLHYEEVKLFSLNNKNENSYKNIYPLMSTSVGSFAGHVHTDDCYPGIKHICSSYGGSCYTLGQTWVPHSHNSSCYRRHSGSFLAQTENYSTGCDNWVGGSTGASGAEGCKGTMSRTHYGYRCSECNAWLGRESSYSCDTCGTSGFTNTVSSCSGTTLSCSLGDGYWESYYYKTCGKESGAYYNGSTRVYEVCDKVVIALSPYDNNQEIFVGDKLETRAEALYLDGHKQEVICNVEGLNQKNFITVQPVKLTYGEYCDTAKNKYSKKVEISVFLKELERTCPYGHVYEINRDGTDPGCPICKNSVVGLSVNKTELTVEQGEQLNIVVNAIYKDGYSVVVDDWTSDFDTKDLGVQLVTIEYKGATTTIIVNVVKSVECMICGYNYLLNIDGSDPGCPICNQRIDHIRVEVISDEIEVGDNLNIQVYSIFKDGREEQVFNWSSDFDPYIIGRQKVNVYYFGFTEEIEVTVKKHNYTICPVCGTEYDNDETFGFCPVCITTIVGLVAETEGDILYGDDPQLLVSLRYQSNHFEPVESGYTLSGFNKYQVGKQVITVTYKNYTTSVVVNVLSPNNNAICINGHVYELNSDGSDPGCPYCELIGESSEDKEATGLENINDTSFDITYSHEVVSALYEKGFINLEDGDYITIKVTKQNNSLSSRISNILFSKRDLKSVHVFGGEVFK